MTSSTVGEIATAFQDEGFAPNPDSSYQDSSVRRVTTQEYLDSVDWSDRGHVTRALRAFERLLLGVRPDRGTPYLGWDQFILALKRDGYDVTEDGQIVPLGKDPGLPEGALAQLRDPAAIEEHLDRIRRSMDSDPALAVGSAKELIESTAKVVLLERGITWDERKDDMPALITKAQKALLLHPSTATPGPDGSDAVKRYSVVRRRLLLESLNCVIAVMELDMARCGDGLALEPATPTWRSMRPLPGVS